MRGVSYWEAGSTVRVGDQQRQGVAAMGGPGVVRSFFRNSVSWAQDPGSGLWSRVYFATEPVSLDGLLLRPARVNLLARSSMVSGTTGLTITAGSGAVALDTAQTAWMFHSSVQPTQQSLRWTAGSPNITGAKCRWPDSADPNTYWTAGLPLWLAVWHRDDGGEALAYSLLDVTKTRYYDSSTTSWGAAGGAETWNPITLGAAAGWTLYAEAIKAHSAGATSLRLRIAQPDGGTASRVNHVSHVELQGLPIVGAGGAYYYSPLVVTDATAEVAREVDHLQLERAGGVLPPTGDWTLILDWTPEWTGPEPNAGASAFLWWAGEQSNVDGTAQDTLAGIWNPVDARIEMQRFDSPDYTTAYCPAVLDGGAEYSFIWRYASGTMGVFVNGTKGTDAAVADIGPGSPFCFGPLRWQSASQHLPGGAYSRFVILPYAMTDAEILAESL